MKTYRLLFGQLMVGVVWYLSASSGVFPCSPAAADDAGGSLLLPARQQVLQLPPSPGNSRNSEGDFANLADGRILFIYSRFSSGRGGDHDHASLASRTSANGGTTWTDTDVEVLPNEGTMNVMSVSLLRLRNGQLALCYLRKNSLADCRPYMRFSNDEAKSWSDPIEIIPDSQPGYYVVNNDRLIQAANGRLIVPVAQHCGYQMKEKWDGRGLISCYLSDDGGRTWRRSRESFYATRDDDVPVITQEPGMAELADGRLLMFIRTDAGAQYFSHSSDGGETWTKAVPSLLSSPLSPASIKRIPDSNDLLAVYNDHAKVTEPNSRRRTPLTTAISKDNGQSWIHRRNLETDSDGWYCYCAIEFVDRHVLLGYCAGKSSAEGLATTRVTNVSVDWLYETEGR